MQNPSAQSRLLTLAWIMTLGASVAVPLFVSPHGRDAFRVPKLAVFQGFGLVLGGILAAAMVLGWIDRAELRRHWAPLALTGTIVAWTAVTAAFSAVPRVSWESALTVISAASFFVAALFSARFRPLRDVMIVTIGALVNVVIIILQVSNVWTALQTPATGRFARIGLLGNPNDVAMYLIAPAVAAAALAIVAKGKLRWFGGIAAAMIATGLLLTESATGIAAAAAAGLAMVFTSFRRFGSRRSALVIGLASILVAGVFAATARIVDMFELFGTGGFDSLMTGRMLAFTAAIEMIKDHPVLGVGPGLYSWQYFAYAAIAETTYGPFSYASSVPVVFSEAHNDHLQIAAETGLPGLFLFWAALGLLIIQTGRADRSGGPRSDFARIGGVPLAVGVTVIAFAQFPLQLPASLLAMVITSGICLAWSSQERER